MNITILELVSASFTILFISILLTYQKKMRSRISSFSWEQYFQNCDIYNNHSHWTRLKTFITTYLQTKQASKIGKEKLLKQ